MSTNRRLAVLLSLLAALTGPATLEAQEDNTSALWTALTQPSFDPQQVGVIERVTLQRDAAVLTLTNGQLGLSQPWPSPVAANRERVRVAAFKGTGQLRVAPTLAMEKQQLTFFSGQEALEAEFTEAVFLFTDKTVVELAEQAAFRPGEARALQQLYQNRNQRWTEYGLNWEPRLLKALLSENPDRHALFVAELNTRQHGWLMLIVDAADPEQVELNQFDSTRRSVSVWTKFPAGGRSPAEAFADPLAHHDYRLPRYNLDVTVEGNTHLTASADVTLDIRQPGERVLLLALDPNLRISEVTDAAGRPLTFQQPRDPKDAFFLGDYLVVVSPEPFAPGPFTLRLRYAGKRIVRKEGSGTFFCQSFGWYPSYGAGRYSLTTNEFAARSDFDLTLRVPKKYQAVATGEKLGEKKEGDYLVTRWKTELPLAVAGFAFGDYKVHTQQVGDVQVEIYANKSADDLLRELEIYAAGPLREGGSRTPGPLDPSWPPQRPVVLGSLAPSHLAPVMAAEVGTALQLFEKWFGPYPYKKLAVANIPTQYSYGQGWPSLLYLWAISFLDSTQRQALGITEHVWLTDFFRAHETSHQWWGHAVGWKSYHDQWLSEGFAEYSGILYTLLRRSPEEHFRLLRQNRDQLLVRDSGGAVYEHIGPVYAGFRLSSAKHPGGYSVVIYNKGGWVLHMLRMMFYDSRDRENPDARFIAMMQDFTKTYFNQAASTEDFQRIVEKHMTPLMNVEGNGRMDWFFNHWVYGTGIPRYEFSYSVTPAPDAQGFLLQGRLWQRDVPASFKMPVAVYVRQGRSLIRAGWIVPTGPETPFEVRLPFKPDRVTLNEWEDVLCTVNYR